MGMAELALGGCTTSTDHLYVAPRGGGDLWSAEIAAACEVGLRFHPTGGSMTLSAKDGGLLPDSVVQDDDVLADSERLVRTYRDPGGSAKDTGKIDPSGRSRLYPLRTRLASHSRISDILEGFTDRYHTAVPLNGVGRVPDMAWVQ
jgi:8-oxoguanine deaminase